jgi:hypothetical protein
MLALFALGVTPKIVIHALAAHHTDRRRAVGHQQDDQYNRAGFHCNVDNLVVESPFLNYSISIHLRPPETFPIHQIRADHQFRSYTDHIFGLRGPPVYS